MGDPRFRPTTRDPRKCDYGRTPAKQDYNCDKEGMHRWKATPGTGPDRQGRELNLCDPHDAEAQRMTSDPPQPKTKVIDRNSAPITLKPQLGLRPDFS